MNVFKLMVLSLSMLFTMTGCGGGGSVDGGGDNNSTISVFSVVPSTEVITANNQKFNVELRIVDNDGNLYNTGTVSVKYPSSFANGRDVGHFNDITVSVSKGIAKFEYTGPSNIAADTSDIVFTFYHSENLNLTRTYTLSIDTTPITLSLVLPEDKVVVKTNQESVAIRVNVMDSNSNPYTTGKVTVNYPSYASTRDVGSFSNRSVDVVNGVAIFNYTSPVNLDNNTSDITFTFYHEDNANIVKTFTVDINSYVPDLSILIPNNELNITQNSQSKSIEVKIYDEKNNPYQSGNIKIIYPDDVQSGRDIGLFAASTAAVSNGTANFEYKGPGNIDTNTSDIVFRFYHEDNPIKEANLTIKIDNSQVIVSNYSLQIDYEDDDAIMGLESLKGITLSLKDDNDILLDNSKINSINIDLNNNGLGTLKDINGNIGSSLSFTNENRILFYIESNTISGILPVKVDVSFQDANDQTRTLQKVFNVIILSGPPTAMSLSYISTSQNAQIAKFTEKWVLAVTDKYNNLVNTEPSVSAGLIAGFTQSSAATPSNNQGYLYYETGGTLNANDTFTASMSPFLNMDLTNDKFVSFGNGYTYNASGKFEISSVAADTLTLLNNYEGNTTTNLGFAMGSNYRQDTCKFGQEWVANVIYRDGQTVNKDTGTLVLDIEYDYYFTGKNIILYVNLIGNSNANTGVKIGEARKLTLRANGLEGVPVTYSVGTTGIQRINIMISGTQISEGYYYNANFGSFNVVAPYDLNWSVVGTSMDDNNVSSCVNSGVAYVDVNITAPAPSGGEISLTNVLPANEF